MAKGRLKLLHVFCTASGAMISSGLFILPGLAYAKAGPAVIVAYFLAGLLAMTGMLSQAELASAMPKAGGSYFYIMRSIGPAVGTAEGLMTWLSLSLKTAFALVGIAAFTGMVTDIDIRIIALALCAFFTLVNILGIREAGRLQVIMVLGLLGILVYYVVSGVPHVDVHRLVPFTPNGKLAVFATAGFVFVSYGGLLKVAAVAEEVDNPSRTIPLAMTLSLLVVGILYTFVVFVTTGVLDGAELSVSLTPISDGSAVFLGPTGCVLLNLAAILAFLSTANAGIMAASRYPVALARDDLIPSIFSRLRGRHDTPRAALLLTGALIGGAVMLQLNSLVKMASGVLILTFLFSCLSVMVMRESHLQNYRPGFRAPLYPWLQIAGIAGCIFLLVGMGQKTLILTLTALGSGLFVYWFYGRIRATREYALLHLVERITSRELTDHLLENELKDIIRERDAIVTDRFDRLIESCPVLDIEPSMDADEFFRQVTAKLAPDLKITDQELLERLRKREEESSTVITPQLAIPHIVLNEEERFALLLARCRGGIRFPGGNSDVHAVFVLAGSRDQRNFHLRALAAIAQIAQDEEFMRRWMVARDVRGLRDVVLLSKRRRDPGTAPSTTVL